MLYFLSTHTGYFIFLIIIFGLIVGSFLNVVIYRLPIAIKKEYRRECLEFLEQDNQLILAHEKFNLMFPASHCPHCKKPLKVWQNIPVFSYVLLRGKCHCCKKKIAIRYPLIELLTALLSVFVALKFGVTPACFWGLVFTWFLISITMIDFDHQLIFDQHSLSLLWIGLLLSCFGVFTTPVNAIVGAVAGYGFFYSFAYLFKVIRKKEGMGQGDFKLFAAAGAWLGWQMLPLVVFVSCVLAVAIGSTVLFFQRKSQQTPIPFGPFIACAMFIALLFGHHLTTWYLTL